jgi:O-methyltransferase
MFTRTVDFLAAAKDELRFRQTFRKYRDFTMIPADVYVGNLQLAMRVKDVRGAIVECGTWRGGMIAGMADVLGCQRHYHLFDSYEGLPPAQAIDGAAALAWQSDTASPMYHNNCCASEEEARQAMSMSAGSKYTIMKGWFKDTLPTADVGPIAILRMDADWYASTKEILDNLAKSVVSGGLIISDDYYVYEGCTRAINEYAAPRNWMIRQHWPGGVCHIIVP